MLSQYKQIVVVYLVKCNKKSRLYLTEYDWIFLYYLTIANVRVCIYACVCMCKCACVNAHTRKHTHTNILVNKIKTETISHRNKKTRN